MSTLRIIPDFNQAASLLRHSWAGIVNIDQYKWLGREDVHDALTMAHNEIGARHVRAAGMFGFDSRVFDLDPGSFLTPESRIPRFNFQIINYYFDSCVDRGVRPMITTCFTPERMATGPQLTFDDSCNITPPKDLGEWRNLIQEMLSQMIARYGREFMRECYFEVWNEPNLENTFWVGGRDRWFELWKTTYCAIKDIDAHLRIGGPSSARGEWIHELIEYGRKNSCIPDYLISHCYNNDSADAPLSPFAGPARDKINKSPGFLSGVVRGVRQMAEEAGFNGEIHWNEWGSSWYPCDFERESENEAAFIVKTMAEVSQEADYFAYWNLSDIYNQVGYGRDTFHGNYGMLNLQNIRKPSYHAHQLLCRLGTKRRRLKVEGGSDCLNAMFTHGDYTSQLLVYNYQAPEQPSPKPVDIEIILPDGFPVENAHLYHVNKHSNNAIHDWNQLGSKRYLSPPEAKQRRKDSELRGSPATELSISSKNGSRTLGFRLPGRGVTQLEWAH